MTGLKTNSSRGFRYILALLLLFSWVSGNAQLKPVRISSNQRFFCTEEGHPFFWLGDTGWLLFVKCTREEALYYLDTRQQQGINVIQVMLLHDFNNTRNVYGDWALHDFDLSKPDTTPGNLPADAAQYDYWDHVDFIVEEAAKRGIYIALVPTWGSNVRSGRISAAQARVYAEFLASRYRDRPNIIWLNGGDVIGSDGLAIWNTIGATLRKADPVHLIGFHPRGRTSSSDWFQNEKWLDFNMFQSGHRSYTQDTSSREARHYGEDNWRYVQDDYAKLPIRPTFDGEPSYEDIPRGLHDTTEGYWQASDIRRYAYWSVFAGGAGFTYGHNSVIQFYSSGEKAPAYFARRDWKKALFDEAAGQMQYLKKLMGSYSYFDRVPAQELVINNGQRYNRVAATRGKDYALFYTYTGRAFKIDLKKLGMARTDAYWFNPGNGKKERIYQNGNFGKRNFSPRGRR